MPKTGDPFIDLMRRGEERKITSDNGLLFYKTQIVVEQNTWDRFKFLCRREHISPSEMLHELMNDHMRNVEKILR